MMIEELKNIYEGVFKENESNRRNPKKSSSVAYNKALKKLQSLGIVSVQFGSTGDEVANTLAKTIQATQNLQKRW